MSWFTRLFGSRQKELPSGRAGAWVSAAEIIMRDYPAQAQGHDLREAFSRVKAAQRIYDKEIDEGQPCSSSVLHRLQEHLSEAVDGAPNNPVVFHEALNVLSLVQQYLPRHQARLAGDVAVELGRRWPNMLSSFRSYEKGMATLRRATDDKLVGRIRTPDLGPIVEALDRCPSNPNAWWALGTALDLTDNDKTASTGCREMETRLNEVFRKDLLVT